jgi:hypothetical protein
MQKQNTFICGNALGWSRHYIFMIFVFSWSALQGQTFTKIAPMPGCTVMHSATLLNSGNIVVIGGYGKVLGLPVAVNMARVFDDHTKQWHVTNGVLNKGRFGHGAIKLSSGEVIVVGGRGQDKKVIKTIELYAPATQQFYLLGKMKYGRRQPKLNFISGNKILITGGSKNSEVIEQIKKDKNGQWHAIVRVVKNKTNAVHSEHATVTLPDGRVVLVSGRSTTIEIFNPIDETFYLCRSRMPQVLDDQSAVVLYDGQVLIGGGQSVYSNKSVPNLWRFDPLADTFKTVALLGAYSKGEAYHGAADMVCVDLFLHDPLRSGQYILFCGGEFDPGKGYGRKDIVLDSAHIYDAKTNKLFDVGPMQSGHDDFAGVVLRHKTSVEILLCGGYGYQEMLSGETEMFTMPKDQFPVLR